MGIFMGELLVSGRVNLFGSSSLVAEWMMFGVPLQHPLGFKEHPLEDADMSIFQSHGFYGIPNVLCHPIGVCFIIPKNPGMS